MKKIAILGGGITGLSLAWKLKKLKAQDQIIVFEKSHRLGGVIDTIDEDYFFEKGPRTFSLPRSEALLKLIQELSLEEKIIYSSKRACKRFIYKDKKLRSFFQLIPILKAVFKDLGTKHKAKEDESVASFFKRRFGEEVTTYFIDPFVTGVYAGNIEKLSMQTAFGEIAHLEHHYNGIIKGLIRKKRTTQKGLFTLEDGLSELIDALSEDIEVHHGSLQNYNDFDQVFVTTNFMETKAIFPNVQEYPNLEYVSLISVNCAYDTRSIDYEGFGYLVPSIEKEKILGVIFDSVVFPTQSRYIKELRLSVLLGGALHPEMIHASDEAIQGIVIDALKRHLHLPPPDYLRINRYENAIPQYPVGHDLFMRKWLLDAKEKYPNVTFVSSFIRKPSVNGRIEEAFAAAEKYHYIEQKAASYNVL